MPEEEKARVLEGSASRTVIYPGRGFSHADFALDLCRDKEPHDWNGPTVDTGSGYCVTCSRCGLDYETYMIRCGE